MVTHHLEAWRGVQRMLAATSDLGAPLLGHVRHFHVKLTGEAKAQGLDFLVPGTLLEGWAVDAGFPQGSAPQRVILRLRAQDWYSVGQYSDTLRILHSTFYRDVEQRVIDATCGTSVVAGLVKIQESKSVVLAEVFSGSFNGWSQAAYVLRDLGFDVHVRWLLDQDSSCTDSACLIHSGPLQVAHCLQDLRNCLSSQCDVFAVANFTDSWWHGLLACPGLTAIAASPPCPPWSTASFYGALACSQSTVNSFCTFWQWSKPSSRPSL